MRGVFLDLESVDRGDLDLDALRGSVTEWESWDRTAPFEIHERIRGAAIVISNKVCLDREALQSADKLKLVCIAATGTNNIDLETAWELGITVCNVTGYATPSVVEHVFALILTLVRRLDAYREAVASGRWQGADDFCLLDFPIRELSGMRLGIIGYGELGRAVATLAEAFGMQALIGERPEASLRNGRTPFTSLLAEAHIISLHCPLTRETQHLIGPQEFALMRSDALLINTARGGIVDETALVQALQTGRIAGAAVDVLSEEPPRRGNPLLDVVLPNLVVTPHIAWASIGARQRLIDAIAANIHAWCDGKPRNVVCP